MESHYMELKMRIIDIIEKILIPHLSKIFSEDNKIISFNSKVPLMNYSEQNSFTTKE